MAKGSEYPGRAYDVQPTEAKLSRILTRARLAAAATAQAEVQQHTAAVERARLARVRARQSRPREAR